MLSFDDMWKESLLRQNERGEEQFPHSKTLIGLVRTLPHSNASAERAFSALTDVTSDKKRSSLSSDSVSSLVAIKVAAKNRKETG